MISSSAPVALALEVQKLCFRNSLEWIILAKTCEVAPDS